VCGGQKDQEDPYTWGPDAIAFIQRHRLLDSLVLSSIIVTVHDARLEFHADSLLECAGEVRNVGSKAPIGSDAMTKEDNPALLRQSWPGDTQDHGGSWATATV
jgi:hypothetical protein